MQIIDRAKKLLIAHREVITYLFIGGTTFVMNIAVYFTMFLWLGDIPANTIAFLIAVIYAYFTNCLIEFRKRLSRASFLQFIGMRIGTIVIDNGGLWLLLTAGMGRLLSKTAINIIVIVVNYVLSKYIIFKGGIK